MCNVAVTTEFSNISREGSELVSKKSDRLQETYVPLEDKFVDRYKQMPTCPEMRQGACEGDTEMVTQEKRLTTA